ncbi:TPA: ArsC family reductase, partial [Escherichia coli]|nr:ArsC family reductase [Escherichia coli]HDD9561708.1 ArsC family reductase [Escherichia coli]
TIKKARRWLEANNIDYRFHDYRVDGLDSELLNDFINELGWEALLNTRGTTWRKLDETTRNKITDAASAAALMTEMPAIIKRPLLCVPGKPMLLGFSDSSYQQFFHEV